VVIIVTWMSLIIPQSFLMSSPDAGVLPVMSSLSCPVEYGFSTGGGRGRSR
jgi:hypothetical protein